jgi:hypothetical protein
MPPIPDRFVSFALPTAAALAVCTSAQANPRPLPFTYPYETLTQDEMELEQYLDASPLRAAGETDETGDTVTDLGFRLQTELEYGITDRLELGLYLVFANDPGGPLVFDGTKQRLRLRLAEQGDFPVDVALYGEVSEFHDELELEQKIILQKRFDTVRLAANLWFEQSFERYKGSPQFFFLPTFGVTDEVTKMFHVGVEYWAVGRLDKRGEQTELEAFNDDFHHYVGPTAMLMLGKLWWTVGAYYRLDSPSRSTEVGDIYGHAWVRTVVGLQL